MEQHSIIRGWKKGRIRVFLRCDEIGSNRMIAHFFDAEEAHKFCKSLRRRKGYWYEDQLPEKKKTWSL